MSRSDFVEIFSPSVFKVSEFDVAIKPLANGDWAMTIFNPTRKPIACNLNWQDFNLTDDEVSKRSTKFDKHVYKVKNLWTSRSREIGRAHV